MGEQGGRGGRAGAVIGEKAGSPGQNVSQGAPDALNPAPPAAGRTRRPGRSQAVPKTLMSVHPGGAGSPSRGGGGYRALTFRQEHPHPHPVCATRERASAARALARGFLLWFWVAKPFERRGEAERRAERGAGEGGGAVKASPCPRPGCRTKTKVRARTPALVQWKQPPRALPNLISCLRAFECECPARAPRNRRRGCSAPRPMRNRVSGIMLVCRVCWSMMPMAPMAA